jgi:hypothetical protein
MTEVKPAIRRLRLVAPLALVAVLAAACSHSNTKSTATPNKYATTTLSTPTNPTSTVPTGTGKKSPGTLKIGKRNLLPLLKGSIRRFAPTQVVGSSLQVVALVGSDAFWAGLGPNKRILIKMRLKGGKAPKIALGQKVGFIGLLTAAPASAGALGVRNGADNTLLTKQGAYVDASAADVHLS